MELLFAGFGSDWLPETVAVLVMAPVLVGVTLIATKAVWFLVRVPIVQVTFPAACLQVPCVVCDWT